MNIFFIESSPQDAAWSVVDKHLPKMILESAQIPCTAHRVLDGTPYTDSTSGRKIARFRLQEPEYEAALYKATHINHPCSAWVREHASHYRWLYSYLGWLSYTYTAVYGKDHKTVRDLYPFLKPVPVNIPGAFEPFNLIDFKNLPPCAMPDEYKLYPSPACMNEVIANYRNYYANGKSHLHKWTCIARRPTWIEEYQK